MTTPVTERLRLHLTEWLGGWPEATGLTVVGSPKRDQPGWDGRIFPVLGVRAPDRSVLSVPPANEAVVAARAAQLSRSGQLNGNALNGNAWDELLPLLPHLLARDDRFVYSGVFRYSLDPTPLPDAGEWVDADHPAVPAWLRPFGHQVLIAWDPDTGAYLAGVGIKHHDAYGQELAVGTEEAARGRGLARRLVAQAARRVIDEGAIPTYQHDPANIASAKVADAAGFPDLGWRSAGMP